MLELRKLPGEGETMQASLIANRLSIDYTPATATAFNQLLEEMSILPSENLSSEAFFVGLMRSAATAESQLPDNLKQNNFGYSIGEGGNYRASIKAIVSNAPVVIG